MYRCSAVGGASVDRPPPAPRRCGRNAEDFAAPTNQAILVPRQETRCCVRRTPARDPLEGAARSRSAGRSIELGPSGLARIDGKPWRSRRACARGCWLDQMGRRLRAARGVEALLLDGHDEPRSALLEASAGPAIAMRSRPARPLRVKQRSVSARQADEVVSVLLLALRHLEEPRGIEPPTARSPRSTCLA